MLELGYKASAEQFGPRQLLEFGVLAEECGFDSVPVSDHFHPWEHTGGHSPFAWAWLGALAAMRMAAWWDWRPDEQRILRQLRSRRASAKAKVSAASDRPRSYLGR